MKVLLQVHLNRFYLLIIMFTLSATVLVDHKTMLYDNSSLPGKNVRFLRPIVVPNLTVSQNSFSSPSRNYLLGKMTGLNTKNSMIGHGKALPSDSLVAFKSGMKPNENSVQKFSSRYSFGAESKTKNDKSKKEEKGRKDKNNIIEDNSRVFGLPENEYVNREPPNNANAPPHFISHSTSKEIEPFSEDVNEAKEEEKVAPSIAISKPQKTTSFSNEPQKNFFSYEEYKDDEGFFEDDSDDEEKLEEAEDDAEKNFFRDFEEKYNSVQTPLTDIKYRVGGLGSLENDFDNNFEYSFDWKKPRTRLLKPMERYSSSLPVWQTLKKEQETESKSLKIENPLDKEENMSVKRNNSKNEIPSKTNEQLNGTEKNNALQGNGRGSKKFYAESVTEKAKSVQEINRSANKLITQTGNELNSSKKFLSPEEKRNQLFKKEKMRVVRPTFYNSTQEIKGDSTAKKIHSKLYDSSAKRKILPRNKEQQDNRKSPQQQRQNSTLTSNHIEESDEMYNRILSNIHSVFGIRTEPLKSSPANKRNSSDWVRIVPEESTVFSRSLPYEKVYKKREENRWKVNNR